MNTPLRLCRLVVPVLLVSPASTFARSADQAIVVVSQEPSRERWVQQTAVKLSTNLTYPVTIGRPAAEGVATVAFQCGQDGRPTQVFLPRSSGDAKLDSAALRAVEALPSLRPLPADFLADQVFLAKIVFTTDDKRTSRLLAQSREASATQFALVSANAVEIRLSIRN